MAKVTLPDIGTLSNQSSAREAMNENFDLIEEAFDNTLSRDGTTPNQMEADIDLNGNTLLNVADPVADGDAVNKRYVGTLVNEFVSEIAETLIEGTARMDEFTATAGQTEFTLSDAPAGTKSVFVFDDGVAMTPDTDFTLTGADLTTLEFFVGRTLGHKIVARYVQLAPADSALRADLESDAEDKGGDLVAFVQSGTGSVKRSVQDKARERLSVLDKIPVSEHAAIKARTSTLDVAPYFTEALDQASSEGRQLYIPAGKYFLASGIVVDETDDVGDVFGPRATIIGDGPSATILSFADGNFNGLSVSGGSTGTGSLLYMTISNLTLLKSDQLGNGLVLDNAAYCHFSDLVMVGWNYGALGTDVLSTLFERCNFGSNNYGSQFQFADVSYPNAITFGQCVWGGNDIYGLVVFGPGSVTVLGGSCEGNGSSGPGFAGMYIADAGVQSGMGLICIGTYFEANASTYDILIRTTSTENSCHLLMGNTFQRISNTVYTTNNVKVENTSTAILDVVLSGNAFTHFNTYTPNAARQYIASSNTGAGKINIKRASGNAYKSAVENVELSGISDSESSLPIAIGRWTVSGGVVTTIGTKNISGVVRNGAGDFTITLQEGATTLLPTSFVNSGTTDFRTTCRALTETTIQVYTRDSAGVLADPSGFGVTIHAIR